jgi:hypothetical protein
MGYSAHVEGFFVVGSNRFRVAKSNGERFCLAEPCELPPGTEGDLVVIVDGSASSRRIVIKDGIIQGQISVGYDVVVPF